ncbi:ribbon-helix-helix domain-containing protein [Limibacillus sp. MBR-115]|jgi:predicted DNA-binding ribbon-helix-helix protein|uniref:ribbon-helix-helix domain-containing protein n=1 Tax=Limibacillus sp. MBR-115 TaxID=3156465 RepID=UPI003397AFEA
MASNQKGGRLGASVAATSKPSTLINRNVTIKGRRTSLRLEAMMWDALQEIAIRERSSLHLLCEKIDSTRSESSLTAGVRVFILGYFRIAATEAGHAGVGHGGLKAPARPGTKTSSSEGSQA